MIDEKLTKEIQDWLKNPKATADGALLLLRFTGNAIQYNMILRNPQKYHDFVVHELEKRLGYRLAKVTHKEVEDMRAKVSAMGALKEKSHAADTFKAGQRPDHDKLPEEIQAIYVEQKSILQRMRAVHARLRVIEASPGICPDSDRYPFLKELIELDTLYHENWAKYDGYNIEKGEIEQLQDARALSKAAKGFLNLNIRHYVENPTDGMREALLEKWSLVIDPSAALTKKMVDAGLIVSEKCDAEGQ